MGIQKSMNPRAEPENAIVPNAADANMRVKTEEPETEIKVPKDIRRAWWM
jgi:hypothetical protein